MYDYDLLTIGAGSGGIAASRRAAEYGARVAIAEERRVGGTCVLRGCVPKKLLVYGAHFRDDIEDAAGYGWTIEGASHDWGKLIANKNAELDRLHGIYMKNLEASGVAVLRGRAVIQDAHTVQVGDETVTAERILVATGSRAWMPEIPGIEHVITSDEALDLPELPKRVVIAGGGYIACEFAGILQTLGAKVVMTVRSETILRGFDGDIRETLTSEMEARGIAIRHHTQLERIDRLDDGLAITLDSGEVIEADAVLYATGRVPNTAGLGLEEAGVGMRDNGAIKVGDDYATAVASIFAIGDVTDRWQLTPVAIAEGRTLAENLYNNQSLRLSYDNIPTAVFSIPAVGTVGMSEEGARRMFANVKVYRARFRPMRHTLSGREDRIMMKLVVDGTSDRVLGAHMIGEDAAEIVQSLAVALNCGATKAQFDQTMALHPSAAEEFVTMRAPVAG